MNELVEMKETMTSIEIGKLTGKEHKNVTRDITVMFNGLEIDTLKFERISKDSMNRDRKIYNLPKRECLILVSGYNVKMRAAIIDRWQELEKAQPQMTQLEMLAQGFAKMAEIENQQKETDHRLTNIEERQNRMDGATGYRTVLAHNKIMGRKMSLSESNKLGRGCSKCCKKRGIAIGRIPDERFGMVNSYPINILDEAIAWLFNGRK